MELKLNIGYQELLELIQQLPANMRRQLKTDISESPVEPENKNVKEQLANIIQKMRARPMFEEITDPVAWKKKNVMSGDKVILDTNTLIFMSKGLIDEQRLLQKEYNQFYVSIITYMELYGFKFKDNREKQRIDEYFKYIKIIHTNSIIAEKAIDYRKNGPRKIKLPDAIILATAAYLEAVLLTDDWDDFLDFDGQVRIDNLDDLKV